MSFLSQLFYGVDLDEAQQRENDLNNQLAAENQRAAARYRSEYGDSFADEYLNQAEEHRTGGYISDVSGEVANAFDEGLSEGASNIRGAVGGTINRTVGSLLSTIPWQLWLVIAAVVIFQRSLFRLPRR